MSSRVASHSLQSGSSCRLSSGQKDRAHQAFMTVRRRWYMESGSASAFSMRSRVTVEGGACKASGIPQTSMRREASCSLTSRRRAAIAQSLSTRPARAIRRSSWLARLTVRLRSSFSALRRLSSSALRACSARSICWISPPKSASVMAVPAPAEPTGATGAQAAC